MLSVQLSASQLFSLSSMIAMSGWVILAIGVALRLRWLRDGVAGFAIPLLLSGIYSAIVAIHWWTGAGGFDSLASVALLFGSEWLLLAGWVHFLAFDLFVGGWIARDADRLGIARWLLIPVLPAVFMFGPAGAIFWAMIRIAAASPSHALKDA